MGQTVELAFRVTGMHCASCAILIDETLEDLPGVASSTTNVRAERTTIHLDPTMCSPDQVAAAISSTGPYNAHLDMC